MKQLDQNIFRNFSASPVFALTLSCLFFAAAGCRQGPERFPVTGTVQFAGEALETGMISLIPDGTQGNSGPSSFGQIKDGRFSIEKRFGVVGGPYRVFVDSEKNVPGQVDKESGKPKTVQRFPTFSTDYLFTPREKKYEIEVEIPKK